MAERWEELNDGTGPLDVLGAVLRDPLQLGLVLGICAGALATAAASARRVAAGYTPPARGNLQITSADEATVTRAAQAAEATIERVLPAQGDEHTKV